MKIFEYQLAVIIITDEYLTIVARNECPHFNCGEVITKGEYIPSDDQWERWELMFGKHLSTNVL